MTTARSKSKKALFDNPDIYAGQPDLAKKNSELQKVIQDAKKETQEKVNQFITSPTPENMETAKEEVLRDELIPVLTKNLIIEDMLDIKSIYTYFSQMYKNCPADYKTLKQEAIDLSKVGHSAFLIMGQRLLAIHSQSLYLEDNYTSFNEFIEENIPLAKATVYFYINVMNYLQLVSPGRLPPANVEYTKIKSYLPILKCYENDLEHLKQLMEEILDKSKTMTREQLDLDALELKKKLGLFTINPQNLVSSYNKKLDSYYKNIEKNMASFGKDNIRDLIKRLNLLLDQDGIQ